MTREEEKMKREIKDIVTCINLYHGKTLVSVCGLPNHIDSVCRLFETFSAWDVNIDMISFTPSPSPLIAIAFTAEASQLENIFKAVGDLKQIYTELRTEVVPERCKVIFSGKELAEKSGSAAYIFNAFAKSGIAIDIITTSHKEISCLISSNQAQAAKEMIESYFGMDFV